SLAVSSYPEKLREVESMQRKARPMIGTWWVILVLTAFVGGLFWAFEKAGTVLEVLIALLILGFVVGGLMLPAVQSAREASRRAQALNDLKQIELPVAGEARAPAGGAGAESVRVRQHFPETLLWRPELITDDQGRAHLDIDLADSITTWRVSLGA